MAHLRGAGQAMTDCSPDLRRDCLDNLLEGVIVIELGGTIAMFNPAAGRILDLFPDAVTGRAFAELFMSRKGFEEFSDLVLDAIENRGKAGRQVVTLHTGGEEQLLSVGISYIRSRCDGSAEPTAVIVSFSDTSKIWELCMAKAVDAQRGELQMAYRKIEEHKALLKKSQAARVLATVLVIGVFLGAGAYTWQSRNPLRDSFIATGVDSELPLASAGADEGLRTVTVEPQTLHRTISLVGTLAPWRTLNVVSPVSSRIGAVHFQYDQLVKEGELLIELDTSEANREHRDARVAYIDALEKFEALKNWEGSAEMADARRSFARASLELKSQRNRLDRATFLLDQGLIATTEYEDTEQQYQNQKLDFDVAELDFEAVRARGGKDARDRAELELGNAREKMLELEENLQQSAIHAPLSGIVLLPGQSDSTGIAAGQSVEKGEVLLKIGDLAQMSAVAKVDELDIVRIRNGQAVSVTGNAFPSLRLEGTVTHVSSQAKAQLQGAPKFDVTVTLDPLVSSQRELLLAGMSSNLTIAVYRNDNALLVPIDAVEQQGRSNHLLVVHPETGEVEVREVEIGNTTLNSVEIVAGLQPGDQIVIPED